MNERLNEICEELGVEIHSGNLQVFSPLDAKQIASLKEKAEFEVMPHVWVNLTLKDRAKELLKFADAVEKQSENLAEIIRIDAGKTESEAAGEVKNFISTILTNWEKVAAKKLDNLGIMQRKKSYIPVGTVGLITSFNFPLAVAGWTIAPALLAGNAVVWKPSEKTPIIALAIKAIFDKAVKFPVLDVMIGGRETAGKTLLKSPEIGMISATGSVGMAQAILREHDGVVPPILEAGGNNALVISSQNSAENLKFALESLLKSFLAGGGQKCTNTRRLFVHADVYEVFVSKLKAVVAGFDEVGNADAEYGYCPLIDEDSYEYFASTIAAAKEQDGAVTGGARLPMAGAYVEPAIVEMPKQTEIMFEECFAPLLFVAKYDDFADVLEQVNAPKNAGLVNGIFTQSQAEVDAFAARNEAGHTVVNSPTGTGTPAHGMGFAGNKDSGMGEILNGEDQLRPFTRGAKRVAQNADVKLS